MFLLLHKSAHFTQDHVPQLPGTTCFEGIQKRDNLVGRLTRWSVDPKIALYSGLIIRLLAYAGMPVDGPVMRNALSA